MEEILAYLQAIDEINQAERAMLGPTISARLYLAHVAAESAWADIPLGLRENLAPPPERPKPH